MSAELAILQEIPALLQWITYVSLANLSVEEDGYGVPLMAALLWPNDTLIQKPEYHDIPKKCEEEVLAKLGSNKGVENLDDLYECISFSNVTREISFLNHQAAITDGVEGFNLTDFTSAIAGYNVTESKENDEIAEKLSEKIGEVLNQGCKDISCGRIKEEDGGEGKLQDEKIDPSCEESAIWISQKPSRLNFDHVFQCRSAMCNRVKLLVKADPDIGGPGVFISYLMQVVLAVGIALYILVKAITGTARRRNREKLDGSSPERTIEAHPAFVRQLNAFQRLQAWFVASLVIAGSIRNFRHHVSNVDRYLFVAITLNALALLSFSLLTVHHVSGKSPWTTVAISIVSYVICAVFYCIALSRRDNRINKLYSNLWTCREEELEGIEPIRKFLDTVNSVPKAVYGVALVFTAIIMVMVTLDNMKKVGGFWHRQSRVIRGIVWGVVGLLYAMVFALQVYVIAPFFRVVDYSEWGFGNLLAVTFFLPLIYDYISERFLEKEDEHPGQGRGKFQDIRTPPDESGYGGYEMR